MRELLDQLGVEIAHLAEERRPPPLRRVDFGFAFWRFNVFAHLQERNANSKGETSSGEVKSSQLGVDVTRRGASDAFQ